jgi:hypothetical protein
MTFKRIKEFGELVAQANRVGTKEIKLDRTVAVELLSEITKILVDRVEQLDQPREKPTITALTGGYFTNKN